MSNECTVCIQCKVPFLCRFLLDLHSPSTDIVPCARDGMLIHNALVVYIIVTFAILLIHHVWQKCIFSADFQILFNDLDPDVDLDHIQVCIGPIVTCSCPPR